MKKEQIRKWVPVLLAAMLTAVLVLCLILLPGRSSQTGPTRPPAAPTRPQMQAPSTAAPVPTQTTVPEQTTEPEESVTAATEPEEKPWTDPRPTEPEDPEPTEETTAPYLQLPYLIPGTDLVLQQVSGYDGIFLEDGQDAPVTSVTAIVVSNAGRRDIEYAEITLDREGTPLQFAVSGLTAGSMALVLESGGAAYEGGQLFACTASAAAVDAFELSRDLVRVEEYDDGSLAVTNLTGETIPCVRIFYKFYMSDEDVYVGGITYTAKLLELVPGEPQNILPSHYVGGMSRVVMVKTYDTAE